MLPSAVRSSAVVLAILGASCASVRKMEFAVETLNTKEESVPCVVFLDDALVVGAGNEPVITPARVVVDFSGADGPSRESVRIEVREVELDDSGRISRGIETGDEVRHVPDARSVRPGDAPKQLFVLRRNRSYSAE